MTDDVSYTNTSHNIELLFIDFLYGYFLELLLATFLLKMDGKTKEDLEIFNVFSQSGK